MGRTQLWIAFGLVWQLSAGCASHIQPGSIVPLSRVSIRAKADGNAPEVLAIGSNGTCGGGSLGSIPKLDVAVLAERFDAREVPAERDGIRAALASASPARGVVLFFSGHGDDQGADGESTICLDNDEWLPVSRLVEWMEASRAPWSVLVLSSCSSAYVDMRAAKTRPIAVISASDTPVGTAPFARQDSQRPAHSALIEALADVYARRDDEAIDLNCDGFLDDREWFLHADAFLRRNLSSGDDFNLPSPRLRSQSRSPLPLWPVKSVGARCQERISKVHKALAALREDEGATANADTDACREPLASQIAHRLDGSQPRPVCSAVDYFFVAEAPQLCGPGSDVAPELRSLRDLCNHDQLHPLPLEEDVAIEEETVFALAEFATFTDIYVVTLDGGWVTARRARDGSIVSVRPTTRLTGLVPPRESVILRWRDGTALVRLTRGAWPDSAEPVRTLMKTRNIRTAACPQEEGQCYLAEPR